MIGLLIIRKLNIDYFDDKLKLTTTKKKPLKSTAACIYFCFLMYIIILHILDPKPCVKAFKIQ